MKIGHGDLVTRFVGRIGYIGHLTEPFHDTMWLNIDVRMIDTIKEMLRPYPAEEMMSYLVNTVINSPSNQIAELTKRMDINSA